MLHIPSLKTQTSQYCVIQTIAPAFKLSVVLTYFHDLISNCLFFTMYVVSAKNECVAAVISNRISASRMRGYESVHLKKASARNKLSCFQFGYVTLIYSTLDVYILSTSNPLDYIFKYILLHSLKS